MKPDSWLCYVMDWEAGRRVVLDTRIDAENSLVTTTATMALGLPRLPV